MAGGVLAKLADADGDHAGSVARAGYGRKWAGRVAVPVAADALAARAVARLVQASAGVTVGVAPAVMAASRSARPARTL